MNLDLHTLWLAFALGLPVTLLGWYLFSRLFDRGDVDRDGDLEKELKSLKKRRKETGDEDEHFLQTRWMKFGGGFYGLPALWTFFCIEASELIGFLTNFPGFESLLSQGFISFLVSVFINQIQNMIAAFVWFQYWGSGSYIMESLIIAYLFYLAGVQLAKMGIRLDIRKLLKLDN